MSPPCWSSAIRPRCHAAYLPWTDRDGSLLRIAVLAERTGPEHCEWPDARSLIVGQPPGVHHPASADDVELVRDPTGAYDRPEITAGLDRVATLPGDPVNTGHRRADLALWHIPGDQTAIWLVSPDRVERGPPAEPPLCE